MAGNMRPPLKKITLVILIIVLIFIGLLAFKLIRIALLGQALYERYVHVQTLTASLDELDIAEVQQVVGQAHTDLSALQTELALFEPILPPLAWLPEVGGDVQAASDLLAMGVLLSAVGEMMLDTFGPTIQYALQEQQAAADTVLPLLIQDLNDSEAALLLTRQKINQILEHRNDIQIETLSPQLAQQLSRFDQIFPLLRLAGEFAPHAASALGTEASKTYLIIAQNEDELRATGGFLSLVGTLILDKGQLVELTFEDSYKIDNFKRHYPDPPAQLSRYMLAYIWVFRDANWSPDFPTAAQDMVKLYNISHELSVDGIITLDQTFLKKVVAALGPISVEGWDEPATGNNVIKLVRQSWNVHTLPSANNESDAVKIDPKWWRQRKSFTGNLVKALRHRLESEPDSVNWLALTKAGFTAFAEGHVQIWMADEALQAFIQKQGWSGAILSPEQDYVFIVDTNMGFNKVNAVVKRAIHYRVDLTEPTQPQAHLSVQHHNQSRGSGPCQHQPRYGKTYQDLIQRCYWNYLRVYVPPQSQLTKARPHALSGDFLLNGQDEPARIEPLPSEMAKTVWGTLLMVPRGETLQTDFSYHLPPQVVKRQEASWHYQLVFQKQAGTQADQVRVAVILPVSAQLVHSNQANVKRFQDNSLIFEFPLKTNQIIELVFSFPE